MHGKIYDTHQLHVISDMQLMTESFIDDALLQVMAHIKRTLIQFICVMKFCLVILTSTFLINYCSLPGSDLGHVTLIFNLSRETHYLSKLCLNRLNYLS